MQVRDEGEKAIDWEDVLAFLYQKRNLMEKFEKNCTQRKKELEVS